MLRISTTFTWCVPFFLGGGRSVCVCGGGGAVTRGFIQIMNVYECHRPYRTNMFIRMKMKMKIFVLQVYQVYLSQVILHEWTNIHYFFYTTPKSRQFLSFDIKNVVSYPICIWYSWTRKEYTAVALHCFTRWTCIRAWNE